MKTNLIRFKQRFFLILILCCLVAFYNCSGTKGSSDVSTQTPKTKKIFKENRIYYDFEKKQLYKDSFHTENLRRPVVTKESNEVQIEISKYNPLGYDIIIEDTAFNHFTYDVQEFSKLIKLPNKVEPKLQAGEDKKIKNENYQDLIDKISKLNSLEYRYKKSLDKYNKFLTYIENINNVYENLKGYNILTKDQISEELSSAVITPITSNYSDIQIASDGILYKGNLISKEKEYNEEIMKIKKDLVILREEIQGLASNGLKSVEKLDFEKKQEESLSAIEEYVKMIDEFEDVRIKKNLSNFAKTMLVYERLLIFTKGIPVLTTRSFPINKDMHTISIYQYDLDQKTKYLYDQININLTRGFRFTVSGGVFVSGLYDEKYSLFSKDTILTVQQVSGNSFKDTLINDNVTAIYSEEQMKISFGAMLFLQAHSQNAAMLNWGGYLGIGALFNDQTRWTGSAGFSLIIGKKQRFFINAGPALSQVSILSKSYETNKFYQKDIDKVPLENVWKYNWMIGFSWKIDK